MIHARLPSALAPRLRAFLVLLLLAAVAPGGFARPSEKQFAHIAALVEQGKIEEARESVDLLLLAHPADPQLLEVRKVLSDVSSGGTGRKTLPPPPPPPDTLGPDERRELNTFLSDTRSAFAAAPSERRRQMLTLLDRPIPHGASEEAKPAWLPYWQIRAALALELKHWRAAWHAGRQIERLGGATADPALRPTLEALEKQGLLVKTEAELMRSVWGGVWEFEADHEARPFRGAGEMRYNTFMERLYMRVALLPGKTPDSLVLRFAHIQMSAEAGTHKGRPVDGSSRYELTLESPGLRFPERPFDARRPIRFQAKQPDASLGGTARYLASNSSVSEKLKGSQQPYEVRIREIEFSPDLQTLCIHLNGFKGVHGWKYYLFRVVGDRLYCDSIGLRDIEGPRHPAHPEPIADTPAHQIMTDGVGEPFIRAYYLTRKRP
jgi:hypothetical protein